MSVPTNHPPSSVPRVPRGARARDASIDLELASDQTLIVHVAGTWTLDASRPSVRDLLPGLADRPRVVVLRADDVEAWDTSLLSWLYGAIQACKRAEVEVDASQLPRDVAVLLRLAEFEAEPRRKEAARPGIFARVGRIALRLGHAAVDDLAFLGDVTTALGRFVTFRARMRRADFFALLQSTGADAVPIITLVSVIIGLILAFVGAVQLRLFGADMYVADLVGIATVREMGAMIVGVILAGRTGAAFAAQLGAMKVTEEIDALTTFGISPIEFLVLPRVVALALMTPLLCLYAMVLAILGGAIVGVGMLGISTRLYLGETLDSLTPDDFYGGMFRVTVYGILIGVTSCLCGMRCGKDAAAVGEATTSAVVASIVVMVIADGVMAVVFNVLGI